MARFGYVCRLRATKLLAKVPCTEGFLTSLERVQNTAQKTACLSRTRHTYTNIHTHTHRHIYIYIYICMYACIYVYIYIYMYMYVCTDI